MSKLPVFGPEIPARERREILEKLAFHLKSAAEQADREGSKVLSAELKEAAYVLFSQLDRISQDHSQHATAIVTEAIRLLAKAYEGRDAGRFLLH